MSVKYNQRVYLCCLVFGKDVTWSHRQENNEFLNKAWLEDRISVRNFDMVYVNSFIAVVQVYTQGRMLKCIELVCYS